MLDSHGGGHEMAQSAEMQNFAVWIILHLHLKRDLLSPFKLLRIDHFLASV